MKTAKPNCRFKKVFGIRSKTFYIVLTVLWLLFIILSVLAFSKPTSTKEEIRKNNIIQKTTFDYEVDLSPSLLYPSGGIVTSSGPIFTRVTRSVILSINSHVVSDIPIKVVGSYRISCKLVSENLWVHTYFLRDKQEFELEGKENRLVGGQISIPIEQILDFIDDVQGEIGSYSDGHLIKITPELVGTIEDGDRKIPIDSSPELTFRLSNQRLEPLGDTEFVNETPIYESNVIHHSFKIMGQTLLLKHIRFVPTIGLWILTIYLGIVYGYRFYSHRDQRTELEKIMGRYRNRLTFIGEDLNISGQINLSLESFKDLVRISEDRDIPILAYYNKDGGSNFYSIDNGVIYSYKPTEVTLSGKETILMGSDLFYVP